MSSLNDLVNESIDAMDEVGIALAKMKIKEDELKEAKLEMFKALEKKFYNDMKAKAREEIRDMYCEVLIMRDRFWVEKVVDQRNILMTVIKHAEFREGTEDTVKQRMRDLKIRMQVRQAQHEKGIIPAEMANYEIASYQDLHNVLEEILKLNVGQSENTPNPTPENTPEEGNKLEEALNLSTAHNVEKNAETELSKGKACEVKLENAPIPTPGSKRKAASISTAAQNVEKCADTQLSTGKAREVKNTPISTAGNKPKKESTSSAAQNVEKSAETEVSEGKANEVKLENTSEEALSSSAAQDVAEGAEPVMSKGKARKIRKRLAQQAAEQQAAEQQAVEEQAAKEQAAMKQAAKEQAAKEQAAKEQAARKQAAKGQAAKQNKN